MPAIFESLCRRWPRCTQRAIGHAAIGHVVSVRKHVVIGYTAIGNRQSDIRRDRNCRNRTICRTPPFPRVAHVLSVDSFVLFLLLSLFACRILQARKTDLGRNFVQSFPRSGTTVTYGTGKSFERKHATTGLAPFLLPFFFCQACSSQWLRLRVKLKVKLKLIDMPYPKIELEKVHW